MDEDRTYLYKWSHFVLLGHNVSPCRDEEKENPRIRPSYRPWWLSIPRISPDWKVAELRDEMERRQLAHSGMKKAELLAALANSTKLYSLAGFELKYFMIVEF